MRWLLDTNVFIDAFAGAPDAIKVMHRARTVDAAWIGFSAITRLEVLGFAGLTAADEKGLREMLNEFVEVQVSSDIIDQAITLRRTIRIQIPDALIAATAMLQNAELVTRNDSDFRRISGLTVVSPRTL